MTESALRECDFMSSLFSLLVCLRTNQAFRKICLDLRLFILPEQYQSNVTESQPHSRNEADFLIVRLLITTMDVFFPDFKVNTSLKCQSLKRLKLQYQNCMQPLLIHRLYLIDIGLLQ